MSPCDTHEYPPGETATGRRQRVVNISLRKPAFVPPLRPVAPTGSVKYALLPEPLAGVSEIGGMIRRVKSPPSRVIVVPRS